ncbi:MAG: hypothetical protein ACYTAO_16120 [Planctomycetota bacterium]|jgi:hypothetical protein
MKRRLSYLLAIILAWAPLTLISCHSVTIGIGSDHRHGPPPHAPAHGHRHKHRGVDLIFDADWGVYVVVGFPRHYYHEGRYYRRHETRWQMGTRMKGPWKSVSENALPPGLRGR